MKSIGYHSNVVNMIGCCTRQDPICLVVEHVALGDLLHYLRDYRAKCQQVVLDSLSYRKLRESVLPFVSLATDGFCYLGYVIINCMSFTTLA